MPCLVHFYIAFSSLSQFKFIVQRKRNCVTHKLSISSLFRWRFDLFAYLLFLVYVLSESHYLGCKIQENHYFPASYLQSEEQINKYILFMVSYLSCWLELQFSWPTFHRAASHMLHNTITTSILIWKACPEYSKHVTTHTIHQITAVLYLQGHSLQPPSTAATCYLSRAISGSSVTQSTSHNR